ncbi:sigma-54-dependent transcriptional regulator [Breznakiella homolactica]|uniref:Sigma-54-dependent Fis family transcriptional regulator n=1 Tax=Breznakiella homolactica TaxID=2798577 RepID=A0A7T7XQM1_9SPIR|nr:sigma-54 dependent transcriptional regulator [Breznakiella homolactica]QQO10690.1 sigma-54 dependent transcriptional regulator [Breznakiella homolactica]
MHVLIVDDERNIRESLRKYLSLEGIDSNSAETGEEAIILMEKEHFDAVILDLKLPGMSGQEVLEWIQARGILSPAIMISAHGEIPDAVEALKSGAKDYLTKPFDPAELIIKLKSLVENKRRENLLEAEKRTAPQETSLIGKSPVMKELSLRIDKIADTDVTVLLTGESGTGKEVVAHEIHKRGPNSADPFVAVNIGGIHDTLMESELFGHEKGAFTGAAARKPGLFELAGRGTLFLDEIGEMPMALQIKLLRVLQERKIRRLGGTSDIPVNARIISATNKNLETLVSEGKFREDLYYRINVFKVSLPPLRERREDIPLLAENLLGKAAARMGKPAHTISPEAEKKLMDYSYPGNVRELENVLERALIYCDGNEIRPEDIDLHTMEPGGVPPQRTGGKPAAGDVSGGPSLEDIEKKAISEALSRWDGNRTKAADELGISRKTIINKIKTYGLEDGTEDSE